MQDTAREVGTNLFVTYSCEHLHMVEQIRDDQLEPIYNSSVSTEVVALKTYQEDCTIETGGERGSGRSLLAAWHDNHDVTKSFNSVISVVGIFVNKPFTFSVLDLSVLQSWFIREGNVIFFSDIILLVVSVLVFFSTWVSFLVCMFAVHESLSCSIWLGVSGFHIYIYLLVDFLYFKVRKPTFLSYCPILVSEPLVCFIKSAEFCPDFYLSFSIPSFGCVVSKIKVYC